MGTGTVQVLREIGVTGQLLATLLVLGTLGFGARLVITGWREFLATIKDVAVAAIAEHSASCPVRVADDAWKKEVRDGLRAMHARLDAFLQEELERARTRTE